MSADKSDDFFRLLNLDSERKRNSWRKKLLKNFKNEVRSAERSSSVFLISSEHFHSRLLTEAEVKDFHTFLAGLFDDIQVICYLRRQDRMALSRYSQALRAGFTPESPLPVLKGKRHIPPYFNFQTLLRRWAKSFGKENVLPRIYSKSELVEGDVVQDFIKTVGLTVKNTESARVENKALSAETQAVLIRINEKLKGADPIAAKRLRQLLLDYLENNSRGRSIQPASAEAREFYERFSETNSVVAQRWFGRELLFDADFSEYPTEPESVCAEKVLDLLADFMLEQAGIGK